MTQTISLTDSQYQKLITVLKINQTADSKEDGIYWDDESLAVIETIIEEIEQQSEATEVVA